MAEDAESGGVARILMKALGALPQEERDAVVEYLLKGALERGPEPSQGVAEGAQPPDPLRAAGLASAAGVQQRRSLSGPVTPAIGPSVLEVEVARLLAQGHPIADVARRFNLSELETKAHLRAFAGLGHLLSGRESEVMSLFAEGLSRAEVAGRMRISEEAVKEHVEAVVDREVRRASLLPLARSAARPIELWPESVTGPSLSSRHQVLPVRLGEAQHRRLKEWCERHEFSMAVVIRGLVERFLDEQERRAP